MKQIVETNLIIEPELLSSKTQLHNWDTVTSGVCVKCSKIVASIHKHQLSSCKFRNLRVWGDQRDAAAS